MTYYKWRVIIESSNNSIFYDRFANLVKKLKFEPINLKQSLDVSAELILTDKKHLDNNPKHVSKSDIVNLLEKINSTNFS